VVNHETPNSHSIKSNVIAHLYLIHILFSGV